MGNSSFVLITDGLVISPLGQNLEQTIAIEGGKIRSLSTEDTASLLLNREDVEIISAEGCYVTPGLIDQHLHGGFGCDFNTADIVEIHRLMKHLPQHGVTGIVPTIMTAPQMDMLTAVNTIEEVIHIDQSGLCKVFGIHLEGPLLNPVYRGAHPSGDIKKPSSEWVTSHSILEELKALISPNVKLVTLAPEMDLQLAYTRFLKQQGVSISAGHSNATIAEMEMALEAGLDGITHLFNAMRPFHHREPGLIAAAFNYDQLYVELIADGVHVHPEAVRMAIRAKAADHLVIISDCLALAGLSEGASFHFGQQMVRNSQGRAINEEGNIAGSTVFVSQGLQNIVRWEILPFAQAVQLVTANPADHLRIGHQYGRILPGYQADLVLWDKETLEIKATLLDGQVVYQKDKVMGPV